MAADLVPSLGNEQRTPGEALEARQEEHERALEEARIKDAELELRMDGEAQHQEEPGLSAEDREIRSEMHSVSYVGAVTGSSVSPEHAELIAGLPEELMAAAVDCVRDWSSSPMLAGANTLDTLLLQEPEIIASTSVAVAQSEPVLQV
jgi:hypothetical protein